MRDSKSDTYEDATSATSDPHSIRAGVRRGGYLGGNSKTKVVAEVTRVAVKNNKIGVNETGRRVGESHQNAKLTDDDVRLILELHCYHGMGYKRLAAKFEVSAGCIQKICNGSRRAKAPVRYR